MRKALEERRRQQQDAQNLAFDYARKLRQVLGPLTAILYGSFARGDFNLGSDIDVLIVSAALPHHPLARSELLYCCAQGGIEPKGYTPAEFARMLQANNAIAVEAQARGIILWDDGVLSAALTLAAEGQRRRRKHTARLS